MNVIVNGERRTVAATALDALLDELGYADTVVATAVNGSFVPADERASKRLDEADEIEILAPMQGG